MVATYGVGPTPTAVGSPSVNQPPTGPQVTQLEPFRLATLEKTQLMSQSVGVVMSGAETVIDVPVLGVGYIYGLDLFVEIVSGGTNSATVAWAEDSPYSVISALQLSDANGFLINLTGYSAKLCGWYCGWEPSNAESINPASATTNILGREIFNQFPARGSTNNSGGAGIASFHLKVPSGINRRSLIGLLGNQDRAQQYRLVDNISGGFNSGAATTLFTTSPTNAPTVNVTRMYESYAVPNAVNDMGTPNQTAPGHFGTMHFLTRTLAANPPAPGAVNHGLIRINNVIRCLILVARYNNSRANVTANPPTNIQFLIGNEALFTETYSYRRELMFQRYGFLPPDGVLVYDFIHDFRGSQAGGELGNDWLWSQQLSQLQFIVTYPTAAGTTANSLEIITADMIVPPGADVYGQ